MNHRLLPAAQTEIEEAEEYYERERPGLGTKFATAVRTSVREAAAHPTFNSPLAPNIRFCRVKKFPYLVIYTIEEQGILVIAVAHQRREPGYWKDRLPTP
jgi:plasmid stabilization system protein ParE